MNQEQDNIMILLELEKNMVKNYGVAITEASNDNLNNQFIKLFNDSNKAQRDIYNYVLSKGWYQIESAEQNKIAQEQQKLSQKMSSMQG